MLERLLRAFSHPPAFQADREPEHSANPLHLLKRAYPCLEDLIQGKRILDFGCGTGEQAVALAQGGAAAVVGVDLQPSLLALGRKLAAERGVGAQVRFLERVPDEALGSFDLVVSQNSFEHFVHPRTVLQAMRQAARPKGVLLITFGPPWFHPYGAHMHHFTRVPWVHLLFPERTVLAVRNRYHNDGAQRYEDVEGGLARMSVEKFERLLEEEQLRVVYYRRQTIKRIPIVGNIPGLRELLTNHVTAIVQLDD